MELYICSPLENIIMPNKYLLLKNVGDTVSIRIKINSIFFEIVVSFDIPSLYSLEAVS